jgi:hypothetical protein
MTMRALLVRPGVLTLASVCVLVFASPAQAHAFGQRFDLPVPMWLFLSAAAAAVVVSFVGLADIVSSTSGPRRIPRLNLLRWQPFRILAHRYSLTLIRLVAVALYLLVLATGFFGDQVAQHNFAPTFVWITWWVGLTYISALAGDLWALVNPWKILFSWAETLLGRVSPGANLWLGVRYPDWLGVYPALLLFAAFAWMENAYPGNSEPGKIAQAALLYSCVTWSGMLVFGRDAWLRGGEAFSVVFSLLARFSPTEVRVRNCANCGSTRDSNDPSGEYFCRNGYSCFATAKAADREWNLRPYAVGLMTKEPLHPSMLLLVMLLLSTLVVDGFLETPLAASIFSACESSASINAMVLAAGVDGAGLTTIFISLVLVLFFAMFVIIYLGFTWLISWFAADSFHHHGTFNLACLFAASLIPIAIAYDLAHYLGFFLVQGQNIFALVSDPFGFQWDLFGTASYRVDIGIVDTKFSWYTIIWSILVGHAIAIYLAHVEAMRIFGDARAAIRSQCPMLLLMVGYTVMSLWILAQPMIGI